MLPGIVQYFALQYKRFRIFNFKINWNFVLQKPETHMHSMYVLYIASLLGLFEINQTKTNNVVGLLGSAKI